jgi:hypothetical protein
LFIFWHEWSSRMWRIFNPISLFLSVCSTQKFEFGSWIHYQRLSVTFRISLKKVP